jgi:hopene-associated glycosyltransferase HpnB
MAMAILGGLAALAWAYLLLGHGRFWRLREWLPTPEAHGDWPAVTVLIPARDEAATIGRTVARVLAQDYPGVLRCIVTDDQSSDGTADQAYAGAATARATDRLTVVAGTPPPVGWTGKLWALEQARRVAADAQNSPWFWLTDADIDHDPMTLRRLVTKGEHDDRDLVSLMVRLAAEGPWARLLIPPFVLFFRMLYPFAWANRPGTRTAAAAGGCVLVRRAALERAGGFAAISAALIDDCSLAVRIKRAGRAGPGRTWIGQADGSVSLRPYRGLGEIWRMVARSAYAQLRYSPVLLAGTLAGLLLVFVVPPVLALTWPFYADAAVGVLGAVSWVGMAVAAAPMTRYYGQNPLCSMLLPAAAAMYAVMTVDSARAAMMGHGGMWKGRAQAVAASDRGRSRSATR